MEGKTHIVGGIAAGAVSLYFNGHVTSEVTFISGCIAGSILPDICHPGSKVGRKLPFLSFFVSKAFGHRTFTHSFLGLMLMFLLFQATTLPPDLEKGILIGAASHLFLDALTAQGIQFLYPFNIRVRFPVHIKTGGILEAGVLTALLALVGLLGFELYL